MTLRNWLLQRAEETPAAPALETTGTTLSFADLADRARRGAAHALTTAPRDAAPLAMLLPGDGDFAGWFHALALTGRAVLPLNVRLTVGELSRQLTDARACWLIGDARDPRLNDLGRRVPGLHAHAAVPLDTLPVSHGPLPGDTIAANATLVVLFTSGTTGRARGACLSWDNFAASARAAATRLGPAVGERWLACMPLYHVGGLSILIRSVLLGGPVRLVPRFEAALVSDLLDGGEIAGLSLVPTMLSRLLAHRKGRAAPPSLRVLLLGGAAASPGLLQTARAAGFPVCPTYGLTEATSQVATAAPPAPGAIEPPSLVPLPGVELRIVADGCELPAGAAGEIAVRGPTVMRGYLNDPTATAHALRDGWLYTGDVGYLDAAGGLHMLDRREDLVISGGENVYPAEVEAVLLEHPAVADAGVTGVQDADFGARVVAWVVLKPGAATDAGTFEDFCRARLAGYKVPREINFVDALPRNAAGKLERRRLAIAKPEAGGNRPSGL